MAETTRVSQIIVKIKGGVRAALEARAVARGLEEVADGADDVKTSALAAALAMDYLSRAERQLARANARLAASQVPAIGGMTLMAITATPLAFVILPALALALAQVAIAAGVWATATIAAAFGVGAAIALMVASVTARFEKLKDVAGTAAAQLAEQFTIVKDTFLDVTSVGADRIMRGLAAGIVEILPLVRSLRDEFGAIGGAIGDMLRGLGARIAGMGPQVSALLAQVPAVVEALGGFAGDALALFVQLATVGAPLLVSALRTVGGWMRDLTDWFSPERVEDATATLRAFFTGAEAWWKQFTAPIEAVLRPALDEGRDALQGWAEPLGILTAGLIQIGRILLPPIAALVGAIGAGLDGAGGGLADIDVAGIGSALATGVKAVIGWVGDLIAALKPMEPFLQNVLIPLFQGVLRAISEIPGVIAVFATVIGWIGARVGFLRPIFQGIGYVLGFVFGGAILKVIGAVLKAIPVIGRLATPVVWLGRAWEWVAGKLWSFVKIAIPKLWEFAGVVLRVFRALPAGVSIAIGVLGGLVTFVATLPGQVAAAASGLWRGIKAGLQPAIDWIEGKLDWVVEKVEWVVEKLSSVTSGALGDAVGNKLGFDPTPGFDLPFAAGGVAPAGVHLVGERGPELAALPRNTRVVPAHRTRGLVQALAYGSSSDTPAAPGSAPAAEYLHARFDIHLDGRVIDKAQQRVKVNREQRS